jgi:hypothetical protein
MATARRYKLAARGSPLADRALRSLADVRTRAGSSLVAVLMTPARAV